MEEEESDAEIYYDTKQPRASATEQAQAHIQPTQHNTGRLPHERPRELAEPVLSSTHADDVFTDDWAASSAAAIARAVASDPTIPPSVQLRTGVQQRPIASEIPSIPQWTCGFAALNSASAAANDAAARDSLSSLASPSPTRGLDFSSTPCGSIHLPDPLPPLQHQPASDDPSRAAAEEQELFAHRATATERRAVVAAALNILAASSSLRMADPDNCNHLVLFTLEPAVIAAAIGPLLDRDTVTLSDLGADAVRRVLADAVVAVGLQHRDELAFITRTFRVPADPPAASRASGTKAASWKAGPGDLEGRLIHAKYAPCRLRYPQSVDALRSIFTLVQSQPRPLVLAGAVSDVLMAHRSVPLELDRLEAHFKEQLRSSDGPEAWAAAVRLVSQPTRSRSTPPSASFDAPSIAREMANQLGLSLGPALSSMADAIRASPPRAIPPTPGALSSSSLLSDHESMAGVVAERLGAALGPALQDMGSAHRQQQAAMTEALEAQRRFEEERRHDERTRADKKDAVGHGSPAQPHWYLGKPRQADAFVTEGLDWSTCLATFGFQYRQQMTSAVLADKQALVEALPSDTAVGSMTGPSAGSALLLFQERRGKVHEVLARMLLEQLCLRSPSPDLERESNTVAATFSAALMTRTYMQRYAMRLEKADRMRGSARLQGLSDVFDGAFIPRDVTPDDLKIVFRETRWVSEHCDTAVEHLRRLERLSSALGPGDHAAEIYAQFRGNIKAVRVRIGEAHAKYEALGALADEVRRLQTKKVSISECIEHLEAEHTFAHEWVHSDQNKMARVRTGQLVGDEEELDAADAAEQLARMTLTRQAGVVHKPLYFEYDEYFKAHPEAIPAHKTHLRDQLLQKSGPAHERCPMCEFLDVSGVTKVWRSWSEYSDPIQNPANPSGSPPFGRGAARPISDHPSERMRHPTHKCSDGACWMSSRPDALPFGMTAEQTKQRYPPVRPPPRS